MKKPYRSTNFNDERKWKSNHPFDDVLQVGKLKAVGYVRGEPFDIETLKNNFIKSGKLVKLISGTLWVGDHDMISLQINIDKNVKILTNANWIISAEEVFNNICKNNEDSQHNNNSDLYHLITELFNSWCLWCEYPIYNKNSTSRYDYFLSQNPYDPDLDNE